MTPTTNGGWFKVPMNWQMEEGLADQPSTVLMVFLEILEFCHANKTGGVVSGTQLKALTRGVMRGKEKVDRLKASGALVPMFAEQSESSRRAVGEQSESSERAVGGQSESSRRAVRGQSESSERAVGEQFFCIRNPEFWYLREGLSPAQGRAKDSRPSKGSPRARVRVEKEREKEREEERTPSGSVRSSSAHAAPRGSEGAAQPAPEDQELGGGRLSRKEAIELARAEIARGRARNPAATGIDTKFSKYDPDRPITPIRSANLFGGELS